MEMMGDTLISSTSGTSTFLPPVVVGDFLSVMDFEVPIGEMEPIPEGDRDPKRPGRLSKIRDFGRWGSGETRLKWNKKEN